MTTECGPLRAVAPVPRGKAGPVLGRPSLRRRARMALALVLATAGLIANAQDPGSPDTKTRQSTSCSSVVMVRCQNQIDVGASKAPDALTPGVQKAKSELESRRLAPSTELGNTDDSIVITGEPIEDPKDKQWERFDKQVAKATIPDCLTMGQNLGLFAVPLVPLLAIFHRCR